jgi:hypothetical protein
MKGGIEAETARLSFASKPSSARQKSRPLIRSVDLKLRGYRTFALRDWTDR